MDSKVRDIAEEIFRLEENEGRDKVISLKEAIQHNVKPGIKLFLGELANAATCEIIRQFWGTAPGFTLIAETVSNYGIALIYSGLARKVITSICSNMFPGTHANPIIQAKYREKEIEFENWSVYSLNQRLMAGALGLPFIPTRSVSGSSMAEENKEAFRIIKDPFSNGKSSALIKSLNPDMAVIHGWVADPNGNTILAIAPITGEGVWGALASKNIVVTVERIVPTSFIRQHSSLVSIPGYRVNSVSVVPFGAHPYGLVNPSIAELEAYAADYDFMLDYEQASASPQTFETWLREWILGCSTHQDYLSKLGSTRISSLKQRASKNWWKQNLESSLERISTAEECNATERMVIAGARKVKERVVDNAFEFIHAGIGTSALAAWVAYYLLRKEGYDIELTMGAGWYGYLPRPGDPWLFSFPNILTAKMIGNMVDAYGVWVKPENKCVSCLGAGQIDKYGNINSTKLPGDVYLLGSGGSNDAINATEVVVIAPQSSRRFVEKVDYITCPGDRVRILVSTKGIFEKLGDNEEFTLTHYFPNPKFPTAEENIRDIKESCGWVLKISPEVREFPLPSLEELIILRLLDPKGYFIKD